MLFKPKATPPPSRKVGLALGGGGARGWAHLGVFRVFEELGFSPDLIAGTSVGSLAGAVLAANRLRRVERVAAQLGWRRSLRLFAELNFPHSGLIDGRAVERLIADMVGHETIEELPLPFCAVATDVITGREVILRSGNLVQAIRASIAIPGIFTPVQRGAQVLVDGGLVNPLPVDVVQAMGADVIVAIEINLLSRELPEALEEDHARRRNGSLNDVVIRLRRAIHRRLAHNRGSMARTMCRWLEQSEGPNIFEIITRSLRVGENQLTRNLLKASPPDLLIQVPVGHLATLDFHRAEEAIQAGYQAASAHRDELKEIIESH